MREMALPLGALALAAFGLATVLTLGSGVEPIPVPEQTGITTTRVVETPAPIGSVTDLPDSVTAVLVERGFAQVLPAGDGSGFPASVSAVLADRGIAITVPGLPASDSVAAMRGLR